MSEENKEAEVICLEDIRKKNPNKSSHSATVDPVADIAPQKGQSQTGAWDGIQNSTVRICDRIRIFR